MTEIRRNLMREVMANHPGAPPYLYHLDRYVRCEDILRWLIRNKLTGMRFVEWVRNEHSGSILQAGASVLKTIEQSEGPRRIIGGKDYLLV